MSTHFEGTICLECGGALSALLDADAVACAGCEERYPLIDGRIPVLLRDPCRHLATLAIHLTRDLATREAHIAAMGEHIDQGHPRALPLENIRLAGMHDKEFLGTFRDLVVSAITVEDLLDVTTRPPPPMHYVSTFDYLQRDWCWLPESEAELREIEAVLIDGLRSGSAPAETALVLGAGAGRIAWDMREFFDDVYATDTSLMMAYQFDRVSTESLETYAVSSANARSSEGVVRLLRASVTSPAAKPAPERTPKGRVRYFVADALNVPLPSASVSAIASVYFTDVVHLEPLMKEIRRLLKPGGVFVHFGPLDYHFADPVHHLSAEEIKAVFVSQGFTILSETSSKTSHLAFKSPMSTRQYDNWAFVAERGAQPQGAPKAGTLGTSGRLI